MGLSIGDLKRQGKRWWLAAVLLLLLGAGIGYGVAQLRPERYASTSQILVKPSGQTLGDFSAIQAAQALSSTYQPLLTGTPLLEMVISDLQLSLTVEQLLNSMTVASVPGTLLFELTVTSSDPQQAALVANQLVDRFGDFVASQPGADNVEIEAVVSAEPAAEPYAPRVPLYVVLGAILGGIAGAMMMLWRSLTDDSLRSPDDVLTWTGRPFLGSLPSTGRVRQPGSALRMFESSDDGYAGAVRQLRAMLLPTDHTVPKSIAVAGVKSQDGASTLAAHLAASIASADRSVVLVDANLRRPAQHRLFGVANDVGLTLLMRNPAMPWRNQAYSVDLPGLIVITSGPEVRGMVDMLDTERLGRILDQLSLEFDVVIVDAPAVLDGGESLAVAKRADGTLLVMKHSRANRTEIASAASSLEAVDAFLVGSVLREQRGKRGEWPVTQGEKYESAPAVGLTAASVASRGAVPAAD